PTKIGLTTLPCFGAGKVSSDSFSQGFKGLCPISYFVVRRIGRFTGILHQWSSSRIFLVQSRVYAINLLFATVVLASLILCARVVDGQFDFAYLDSRGLFVSIFASIFAVEAMKWLVEKKVTIQIKGLPDMIGKTFEAILPLLIIILVSVTFHRVVIYLSGGQILPEVFTNMFAPAV